MSQTPFAFTSKGKVPDLPDRRMFKLLIYVGVPPHD